ncbi:unnamed protein product [Prorocentrum cordatum]|uniref:Uncharacterized protein n=1 Tax=Prorocentrum cordatum TaxID=2364126 RepID=A0ABN9R7A6_9DINO|nr:unnamed protein product [Polarella glacialis]
MRAAVYVRRTLLVLCFAAATSARGEQTDRPPDDGLIARRKIGPGRAQFVRHGGLVWTVAIPAGKTGEESVAEQTRLALADLDQRLAAAGTDKTRVLDAVVFLSDVSTVPEMDEVWVGWCPEGCEPSLDTPPIRAFRAAGAAFLPRPLSPGSRWLPLRRCPFPAPCLARLFGPRLVPLVACAAVYPSA